MHLLSTPFLHLDDHRNMVTTRSKAGQKVSMSTRSKPGMTMSGKHFTSRKTVGKKQQSVKTWAKSSKEAVEESKKGFSSKKSIKQVKGRQSTKKTPQASQPEPKHPGFALREDSQEAEYAVYLPKLGAEKSVPTPPATSTVPPGLCKFSDLGYDILVTIMELAANRKSLYVWQQVSYTLYTVATSLLYASTVTLDSRRLGHLLRGTSARRSRADGVAQPRICPKIDLLAAIKVMIIIDNPAPMHDLQKALGNALSFPLPNIRWIWVKTSNTVHLSPASRLLLARTSPWNIKIGPAVTEAETQQARHTIVNELGTLKRHRLQLPVHPHDIPGSAECVELVITQHSLYASMHGAHSREVLTTLQQTFNRLAPTEQQKFIDIYGAGTFGWTDALQQTLAHRCNGPAAIASPNYMKDVSGDEAARQAAFENNIRIWMAMRSVPPHCHLPIVRFKLLSELKPFFAEV